MLGGTIHFSLAQDIFKKTGVNIQLLTGKTERSEKSLILKNILSGKTNLVIGTHALFQKSIDFKNLSK